MTNIGSNIESSALAHTKISKNYLDEWFVAKGEDFYRHGIHKLLEGWEKCITSMEHTFNKALGK